uniref:Gp16 n=1 Tax=Helicoverpa armigera nucleopolyhedrovirus TaxID=51313 RepID=A0A482ER00_9ABAC|nr:gp16 [Helicoverpa armigera nucleopolyhedrovirus]
MYIIAYTNVVLLMLLGYCLYTGSLGREIEILKNVIDKMCEQLCQRFDLLHELVLNGFARMQNDLGVLSTTTLGNSDKLDEINRKIDSLLLINANIY